MNPRKAVKELEKQLRKDPSNLVLRVRLAGALVQNGQLPPAVEMYRSVALAYVQQGRIDQAIAVCHSLLEIAPDHRDTRLLLGDLDRRKAAMSQEMAAQAPAAPEVDPADPRRRPVRPSGFDADAFTPGSEPELVGPSRVRRYGSRASETPPGRTGPGRTGPTPLTPTPTPPSSVTGRLPLPLTRTMHGLPPMTPASARAGAPGPGGPGATPAPARGRGGEAGAPGTMPPAPGEAPAPARGRRPSDGSGAAPARRTEPPPLAPPRGPAPARGADPDEEAPTRVADRWQMPVRPRPTNLRKDSWSGPAPQASGPGRPGPRVMRENSTVTRAEEVRLRVPHDPGGGPSGGLGDSSDDLFTNPRGLSPDSQPSLHDTGGGRRPRVPHPDGEGEGEATVMDDGFELARALGRPFDDSAVTSPGPGPAPRAPAAPAVSEAPLSLLSGLARPAVDAIAAGMVRRRVASGELILREGEPGDSCFVLAHGEARVLKRDPMHPRGDLMEVSRLTEGDLFGEVAMLSDQRRHASVQAVSDCELLEIPRAHLAAVSARYPDVDAYLARFYRERIISTLVTTAPFFRPLEPSQRTGLIGHFQFSRAEAGARVIREGERAGGFYLVVLGAVEITKRVSQKRQVLLATLGEGSYFGEMSLLRGDVARASVTATGPTELAVLPAKNFYALVANHPILWDQVRQEAHRRELELVQMVTGVSGSV